MIVIKIAEVNEEYKIPSGSRLIEKLDIFPSRLRKNIIGVEYNGRIIDLLTPIETVTEGNGKEASIITTDSTVALEILRHSCSHVMAQAVKRLFPDTKLAIGPAIKDGFYYDFDFKDGIDQEAIQSISEEMKKIIAEDQKFERFTMGRKEAIKFFEERGESYKIELIEELPEDEEISFYKNGEFIDLCRGPHLPSTGYIKAFKLLNLAGAYWRGDERNPMLTRIYGTAFFSEKDLKAYLNRIEEAKRRDHRKLGKELGIFSLHDEGPGFPFWLPNGVILKNVLLDFWREEHRKAGYVEIQTPLILKKDLWVRSGHWDNYRENMYTTEIDEELFAIKPMNCPGGMLVYKEKIHSYRDFPLRVAEVGIVHRHEKSGVLQGLFRVRCFTQDDAHIFLMPNQIEDEIVQLIGLIDRIYSVFGFRYHVELSTRPKKSIGTDEQWEVATRGLENALKRVGIEYQVNPGEGAFYGPKIDFHLEDCLGRLHQCATIQLDMALPERFDLTYVNDRGEEERPVVIHRTVLGSLERFIGILIEHYGGRFPLWLAPVQVVVCSITQNESERAREVYQRLFDMGFRVEIDIRNEKLGYKLREAEVRKIPYMIIIGKKEVEKGDISIRRGGKAETFNMNLEDFAKLLSDEIKNKKS